MTSPFDVAWSVLKSEKSRQRAERRERRRQQKREHDAEKERLKQHTDWEAGRDQRQVVYEEELAAWEAREAERKERERDDAMNRPERRAAFFNLSLAGQRAREMIEASRTKVVDDPMARRPQPPPDVNPFEPEE